MFLLTYRRLPLNVTSSLSVTLNAGSSTTVLFTFIFPSLITLTASLLLVTPQCAKNLFSGISPGRLSVLGLSEAGVVVDLGFGVGLAAAFAVLNTFSPDLCLKPDFLSPCCLAVAGTLLNFASGFP